MRTLQTRRARVLQFIAENPAVALSRVCAVLAIELNIREEKVEEYIRTWGNAGRIIVDSAGRIWTKEAKEQAEVSEAERQFLAEDQLVSAAKQQGMSPLESFDLESK